MLPEVGLGELLLTALVALVVMRPGDIPEIMRRLGVLRATLRSWGTGMWLGIQEDKTPGSQERR